MRRKKSWKKLADEAAVTLIKAEKKMRQCGQYRTASLLASALTLFNYEFEEQLREAKRKS